MRHLYIMPHANQLPMLLRPASKAVMDNPQAIRSWLYGYHTEGLVPKSLTP